MKRRTSIIMITLLLVLSMSFTLGSAAGPGGKKTPAPDGGQAQAQVGQPDKPADGEKPGNPDPSGKGQKSGKDNPSDNAKNPDKGGKPDDAKGPKDKTDKEKGPKDSQPNDKAKTVHVRGVIVELSAGTITLKDGTALTTDAATSVHIPTVGKDSSPAGLNIGVEITAKAVKQENGDLLAISINVIPGKPTHSHGVGIVDEITVDESGVGTIKVGSDVYQITKNTVYLPKTASLTGILPGTRVTIVSSRDVTGGALVAKAIVVHSEKPSDPAPKP